MLLQVGIPREEPPDLRVVVPGPHMQQPRIPIVPAAGGRDGLLRPQPVMERVLPALADQGVAVGVGGGGCPPLLQQNPITNPSAVICLSPR